MHVHCLIPFVFLYVKKKGYKNTVVPICILVLQQEGFKILLNSGLLKKWTFAIFESVTTLDKAK